MEPGSRGIPAPCDPGFCHVPRNPPAAGAKATELTKVAKDKAAERMPKITETAKSSATKVRGQFDRLPGRHAADTGADSEPAAVNGTRPAD